MNSGNSLKRLLSLAIAFVMLFSLIPAQVAAMEDHSSNNQNNASTPVEEWNYTPGLQTSFTAQTLLSDGDSTESSADIVEVKVTAVDRSSGETVTVEGADVNLYVGGNLISTTASDSDGIAKVSLAGLTIEQRQNATISANKIVSRGKAINGTARDDLFEHFPTDENGEYYRYTMELHSETIDENGNWKGAEIPTGKESNKVDIVFIIDATGSMSGEINNVKNNIASFSENLINSGLDIRFCIIDYRDITLVADDPNEDTHVHTISGSHWMKDIDSVVNTLASIDASGGGDGPESVLDPLGYVADNSLMKWRSDAYQFAFVLTDADYKNNNNYGYSSMSEVSAKLAAMGVVTSVITSSSYKSTYSNLYNTTGGIYADINSSTFNQEMLKLSDSIIESVTREMMLKLSEPRLLVNMSVCYFADDKTSQSDSYKESVKNMLNEYSHRLAEASDGHVMIDKILLFSTSNRLNFYTTSNIASMADLRIETEESDDGTLWFNVKIHSNAHTTGFYSDNTYTAAYDEDNDSTEHFSNLKNGDTLNGRSSFYRIQMSGVEGAGWNNSMVDDAYAYSTTVMHESGHYVLGLFDEYLDADNNQWSGSAKPYAKYGLMDNQHSDIEISKTSVDYAYMTAGFSGTAKAQHTAQSWKNGGSCEDSLATLLTDPTFSSYYYSSIIRNSGYNQGNYAVTYTKAAADRTAGYTYAELTNSDFLTPVTSGSGGGGGSAWTLRSDGSGTNEPVFSINSVTDATFTVNDETVTITVSSDAVISIMKAGDEEFTGIALTDGIADLPIAKGELAEVRVTSADGAHYNTYYIDRSENTTAGYMYTSADNAVMAYVTTDEEASYTFIADNTGYTNDDYLSMNQATWISSDNGVGFDSGEIYSVANYLAEIDYTTLSWFKYADGEWTALATDYSEEENMNIGARADLDGEGMYVLMAKLAPVGEVLPAENLSYTQSADRDAVVNVTFDDPNTNSKYYNVYYSESAFTDKNADGVVVRSFDATSTNLTINLLERGRTVYAAVEIVAEDGSRSELSEIILIGGEADSDDDGIPDWYCDKYLLWGEDGEDKDIANSDDDGDGLTNLEEYQGGSDPTNPNDPVHTTNVPVESISVSATELTIGVGDTAELIAIVTPENATNKNVNWTSANTNVVTVEVIDGVCIVTAVAEGETQIYAVTADGGYSAVVDVSVVASVHKHNYAETITDPTCTDRGYTTYTCECGDSYVDEYVDELGHNVVLVEFEDATCELNGYEYYACDRCGGQEYTVILEAKGHSYVNGECEHCGEKNPNYKKPGLSGWFDKWFGSWWGKEECEHTYTSVVTAPTCTDKGYTTYTCSKCKDSYKDTYTNALGHAWDEGKVTKEATCTNDGLKTYTCETCGKTKTETIKAYGHQYENGLCQHCGAEESTKPNKPGWGNIWDWISGWWK